MGQINYCGRSEAQSPPRCSTGISSANDFVSNINPSFGVYLFDFSR